MKRFFFLGYCRFYYMNWFALVIRTRTSFQIKITSRLESRNYILLESVERKCILSSIEENWKTG